MHDFLMHLSWYKKASVENCCLSGFMYGLGNKITFLQALNRRPVHTVVLTEKFTVKSAHYQSSVSQVSKIGTLVLWKVCSVLERKYAANVPSVHQSLLVSLFCERDLDDDEWQSCCASPNSVGEGNLWLHSPEISETPQLTYVNF